MWATAGLLFLYNTVHHLPNAYNCSLHSPIILKLLLLLFFVHLQLPLNFNILQLLKFIKEPRSIPHFLMIWSQCKNPIRWTSTNKSPGSQAPRPVKKRFCGDSFSIHHASKTNDGAPEEIKPCSLVEGVRRGRSRPWTDNKINFRLITRCNSSRHSRYWNDQKCTRRLIRQSKNYAKSTSSMRW